MTNRTVGFMLTNVWMLPALISFTPIFLGWYTTADHLEFQRQHPTECLFKANKGKLEWVAILPSNFFIISKESFGEFLQIDGTILLHQLQCIGMKDLLNIVL